LPEPTLQDITDLSALALSSAIAEGRLDCRSVMAAYLSRIEVINPRINAIVSMRPTEELLAEA
jgi:amidase